MGYAQPKFTVVCSVVTQTVESNGSKLVATRTIPITKSLLVAVPEKSESVADHKVDAANGRITRLIKHLPQESARAESTSANKRKSLNVDVFGLGVHWVLINKLVEYTGYTDDAIRAKKQRGEWKEGVHWRKGPDNRLLFNLVAIQRWLGGQHA